MAARVRSQAGRLARRSLDVFDVCGGVLCVSSWPCKLFSLCGERGSLYGRVSGLLVAVVPLGGQGRRGTWASVAAGCGLNTRSGQDLEHRLHHRGVWVACGLFPDRGRNPRLLHGHGIVDHGARGSPSPELETDLLTSPLFLGEVRNDRAREKDTTWTSFRWDP